MRSIISSPLVDLSKQQAAAVSGCVLSFLPLGIVNRSYLVPLSCLQMSQRPTMTVIEGGGTIPRPTPSMIPMADFTATSSDAGSSRGK